MFSCDYIQILPLKHTSLYDSHLLTTKYLPTQVTLVLVAFIIAHCPDGQAEIRKSDKPINYRFMHHTSIYDSRALLRGVKEI